MNTTMNSLEALTFIALESPAITTSAIAASLFGLVWYIARKYIEYKGYDQLICKKLDELLAKLKLRYIEKEYQDELESQIRETPTVFGKIWAFTGMLFSKKPLATPDLGKDKLKVSQKDSDDRESAE